MRASLPSAIHRRESPRTPGSGSAGSIPRFVRLDFAGATQTVFYVMAAVMAAAAVVAILGLRRGAQQEVSTADAADAGTPAADATDAGSAEEPGRSWR